jgi:hypothetical protein
MFRNKRLRPIAAVIVLAGAAAIGTSGCVLVPAPVPAPVVVAPRPPVVIVPGPVYGGYGYYGWRRW